jgi:hypothetical protein
LLYQLSYLSKTRFLHQFTAIIRCADTTHSPKVPTLENYPQRAKTTTQTTFGNGQEYSEKSAKQAQTAEDIQAPIMGYELAATTSAGP